MAKKDHMNIVFIGHVDSGKSTTVGRILYETGAISEQTLNKLKDEAAKVGKATFEFAFVMDELKEERERGVTIDISHREFETAKYYFTIIDAPGHRDFVKNMIRGTSQADAAALMVSAKDGIEPQTKEHAFLAKVLGINQIIININKMDAVNYDKNRFDQLKDEVSKLLTSVGYKADTVKFVPCSSYNGDNVTKKSDKMPPAKPLDKPLRIPIQDAFSVTGHGTVAVGVVVSGILKPGDSVVFMPSGLKSEVKKIEMHKKELPDARPGDNIGFNVKSVDSKAIKHGEVAGLTSSPPTVAADFTAQVVVLNHPTAISVGYTPEILEKKDPKSGQTMQAKPDFIKTGDIAIVKVQPLKAVCVEKFQDFPSLGRFSLRDMGQTVAAGVVLQVTPKTV